MRTPLGRVSRRGRVTIAVLAVVFLLFTVFDRIIDAWTDWLWFSEVNYTDIFTGILRTRLLLFTLFGVAVGVVVAGNLYLAYRMRPLLRPHSAEQHALDRYRLVLLPHIGAWIGLAAGLVGLFAGLSAQGHWQDWLLFQNSIPFGVTDPQYGVDVSYYVFEYPFWRYLVGVGFTTVVLALLGALGLHYLFGGVRLQGAGDRMTTAARAHLSALVAAFVLLKAVAYFLDRRGLLLNHNEAGSIDLYGGFYTDINALLPAKEILSWISVVVAIAILVFANAFMRNLVWPGLALGLLVLSAVAVGGIYPAAVQSFTVKPSPLSKEEPYMQKSINATLQAYGLTDVQTQDYQASTVVPPADLPNEAGTVSNIRILDPNVVGATFTQLQQVRGFYEFNQRLDIDRYSVNGQTRDFVVGVREIDYSQLNGQQANWQNRHTVFTHGYGFVSAPANRTVCQGQPFFVSGFLGDQSAQQGEQCASPTDQIPTEQPRIYYGERAVEYAIVGKTGGDSAEFDRPAGGGEERFTYDGSGGVSVGAYGRRLLYAMYFKETNFLLSSVFNDNSKVLYVREPAARVRKVAPFLTLDSDPYPAVVGGRVLWIMDAYTTASTYPYSQLIDWNVAIRDSSTQANPFPQPRQDVNYLRNSVKATVDAYTGEVTLYAFDEADPVLRAWNKAFGGKLVKARSEMSKDLIDHIRYPEDQFKVQRDLLSRFHVERATDFFSGQDFWQVPKDPNGSQLDQPPYYIIAKFPGQDSAQFQLTAAMVPRGRVNLASLVSASYVDGRTRIQVLELPRETATPGPNQVHERMNSVPDVREDVSLFQRENSQLTYGNLLSLPVGGGMLYVEPMYLQSKSDNAYPLQRKVLLSYGTYVAYADTLEQGLKQLVDLAAGQPPPPGGTDKPPPGNTGTPPAGAVAEAVAGINKAIVEVRDAQKSGDFERYGRALKALEDAVARYETAVRASAGNGTTPPSTPPSPTPSAGAGG